MKRTILVVLAIFGIISFSISLYSTDAKASSINYTMHVYAPSGASGCYAGPVSANFTMGSSHIAFELPAGTYTVCVEGGGQETVVLPSSDQSANCDYSDKQRCPCTN